MGRNSRLTAFHRLPLVLRVYGSACFVSPCTPIFPICPALNDFRHWAELKIRGTRAVYAVTASSLPSSLSTRLAC